MRVRFTPLHELSPALSEQLTKFSPYTSPLFLSFLDREFSRAGYFTAGNDDGVIAALPAVEILGAGLFARARMQALVDGLPAPMWILQETKINDKDIRGEIVRAISCRRYLKACLTDYDNLFDDDYGKLVPQKTSVIDLVRAASEGETFPPDKTLRSEIAKAGREGVQVAPLHTTTQMDDFIRLMKSTEERHGRTPRYSWDFWQGFGYLSERDPRFQILCVYAGHELAAAHVFIIDRDTALNWQIYFDKKYSSLKPNQAITAFAIRKFGEAGVRFLNLGATPPEATGVEVYKSKWGGVDYTYRTIEFRSLLGRVLR
jgi:hypothetical protein